MGETFGQLGDDYVVCQQDKLGGKDGGGSGGGGILIADGDVKSHTQWASA